MSLYNAYPPHRLHSTRPIASSEALSLLSSYIAASADDASLHPNALLTEKGPISANTGSNIGLVLHNLKRVEAGLQGKHLGADLSFTKFEGEYLPEPQTKLQKAVTSLNDASTNGSGEGATTPQLLKEGWQDKADYEREQEITEGEIGSRVQAVFDGPEDTRVPHVHSAGNTGDKQERKQRKKEKRLKEKREREEQNRRNKMTM